MNVALLNVRITIQKETVATDTVGNHINTWSDWFICTATVSGEIGSEAETAGMTADNTEAAFTVRYSSETAVIEPTQYRIVFSGQLYDILSVDHMNYKRKAVKLKCRKARR